MKKDIHFLFTAVIDTDLCCRCGTCVGLCPERCFAIEPNSLKPQRQEERRCISCGRCVELCPGYSVPTRQLYEYVHQRTPRDDELYGVSADLLIGRSTDEGIYGAAAGGGMVTQLLNNLLRNGVIDAAVIAGYNTDAPYIPEGKVVATKEALVMHANSKYVCIPVNEVFASLRGTNKRIALVGLPCAITALRKGQMLRCKELEAVTVTIGLFCGINIGQEATNCYLDAAGIDKNAITAYSTRTKADGYGIAIALASGKKITRKNIALHLGLSPLFTPARCRLCPDFTNEFADISVGDTWRNDGKSLVVLRTETGARLFRENREDIETEPAKDVTNHFSGIINKRIRAATVREIRARRHQTNTAMDAPQDIYRPYRWRTRDRLLFHFLHWLFIHRAIKKISRPLLMRNYFLRVPIDKARALQFYLIGKYVLAFWNTPLPLRSGDSEGVNG